MVTRGADCKKHTWFQRTLQGMKPTEREMCFFQLPITEVNGFPMKSHLLIGVAGYFCTTGNRNKMTAPVRGQKLGCTTSHSYFARLGSLIFESWEGGKMKEVSVPVKNMYLICLFLKKEESNTCNYLMGVYVLMWNCLYDRMNKLFWAQWSR